MASNLKRRIQLCQIFGQLLKAGSFLHKVIFKVRLSYKDVRTVFSLSFALNGDFTKNTIFPKEQMALLHTKKKKRMLKGTGLTACICSNASSTYSHLLLSV